MSNLCLVLDMDEFTLLYAINKRVIVLLENFNGWLFRSICCFILPYLRNLPRKENSFIGKSIFISSFYGSRRR